MKSCIAWSVFLGGLAAAKPLVYDGRAPLNLTAADLDASNGPYLTVVKGATQNATHYTTLLGPHIPPTPLWSKWPFIITEQALAITIGNTSIFVPGSGAPQNGFRRTELIAQTHNNHTAFDAASEVGTAVYHFSIRRDEARPLDYEHEYQIVFIEPGDGSHVFGVQLGSPFTNPTGPLPSPTAHTLKILDRALNVLYAAPFTPLSWHNVAVQVGWADRTLGVFYSKDGAALRPVTPLVANAQAQAGAAGQGDFHFGLLKLPLVNPADAPANQGDVVHFGIQEGTTEGLVYSGVFVESAAGGVSAGNGATVRPIS